MLQSSFYFVFLDFCEIYKILHRSHPPSQQEGDRRRMKRHWDTEELIEHWTLMPPEHALLANKTGTTRLGFAVLLKFFQYEARFPTHAQEIPSAIVAHLAKQVEVPPDAFAAYDWQSRTSTYHRQQIRAALGFRELSAADTPALTRWLQDTVLPTERDSGRLAAAVYQRCRELRIEPPTPERVARLVGSAAHSYEEQFCQAVAQSLSPEVQTQLEALLLAPDAAEGTSSEASQPETARSVLHYLKADPGRASVEGLLEEVVKLERLRAVGVPADLFRQIPHKVVALYRQRLMVEEPFELRRHPQPLRLTLLAAFCVLRSQELTDTLVDVLLQLVHRIGSKAERRVEHELLEDLKRVSGKHSLLFRLADASLARPDGLVREVVYPIAPEAILQELVKEWRASGPTYRRHLYRVIRNSYRLHYRRMVPRLLATLEFRSNNDRHQPLIQALALLKQYAGSALRTYPVEEQVPLEGVVPSQWRDAVREVGKDGQERINRVTYEICVLQTLRERVRCKELWVVGANRYRNPEEDLPHDFEQQRDTYYASLNLPLDADTFLARLRHDLSTALQSLDHTLPKNPYVKILPKRGGWIALSPLEAQPEPVNLSALKAELGQRWPMTSLLDMLKETDFRVGFTDVFKSVTAWENLDRATLQQRLLLCLHGVGTGAGLKRMSAGEHGVSYKDLLYVRRRFITKEHLRAAIMQVVNAILRVRQPHIWGEATTACASDAKKFGAWDQNLMTEWHVRYGGRGIMIYWHVERKSTCIYSQLKTCSSSEVAAMIDGVLRHCTEMTVTKQYVDSHGQSEVAFAFCHLLGFTLLPRLKAIHAQKLYRADAMDTHPHLERVLTRAVDWGLIRQQYDQMVKYATALRLGTAETEAILRRFTRSNLQHPTYKALAELGKVLKTIFLCQYLQAPELRREIQEGLNVIENWNSANGFILYGKGGEIATNRREEQELTMLSLHLLQLCLVYINTLMLQRILGEPQWDARLTPDDLRGLTPLMYHHVTPYGIFRLDMNDRLVIEEARAA
jgi:TnpA family transposase